MDNYKGQQLTTTFGVGLYSRAEAARLLNLPADRVRRWVSGYTYWLARHRHKERRSMNPVIASDVPKLNGIIVLSFLELMELRMIKAFVDRGFPLQTIRRVALRAEELFETTHPFASNRVYTSSNAIFMGMDDAESSILDLVSTNYTQMFAEPLLRNYLTEVEFDQETSMAHRWWPLTRDVPVVLDPKICFGAPTVEGTRTRTDVVASIVRASSIEESAEAYNMTIDQVMGAVTFEDMLMAA